MKGIANDNEDMNLRNMTYRGFGYVVDSCPTNETGFISAATRLNCIEDLYGRNQYTCVPNEDRTALVEFCYSKIVGLYQKGYCLVTTGNGTLDQISCHHFMTGCPEENFRGTDQYKFSACSRINTESNCFYADPSCPNITLNPNSTIDFLNTAINTTMDNFTTEYRAGSEESSYEGLIIGSILCPLFLLSLIFAFIFWKKRKMYIKNQSYEMYIKNQSYEINIEVEDLGSLLPDETVPLIPRNDPRGEYSVWESPSSDQFSTLTDDEVSVLFCFLCSDSGSPDFTDTEWLDILNKIRQEVYDKDNSITPEEAQKTLHGLKSSDYLWEDQENIKEDTKDETMYRIASKTRIAPFCYGSYNTASVYLRSKKYCRKPGEKCVCSSGRDSLLIRRLQMNILTHVTMEDTRIFDNVSKILMIPKDIVQSSMNERERYLDNLERTGETVRHRRTLKDSVQQVTWLWRQGREARPDNVRSCIGLHPHWDIYIINNIAYKKANQYHQYSPDVRCLLYSVLLMDQYTFDVNNESHKDVLNKLKERYFKDLFLYAENEVANIPEGIISRQKSIFNFISEDIRHDVMYAFVTECLVEDSDLEFFLTTASRDVISEYCRSWDYEKSEGERCLYIPRYPEKMYDLFIDKLRLDIIVHCTMSDECIQDKIIRHLKVPREVMKWEIDARKRFVEQSHTGRKNVCRARGMIVGCAGAGKTTLLRNLQRTHSSDWPSSTETTTGLEIHEDLFEVKNDTLIDFDPKSDNTEDGTFSTESQDKHIISMTDFAGQVAYYACHQIYLSRRAFYLVVIDMSKGLDEEVHKQDTDRHNPKGSLFHGWTNKEYFLFWLRTIKTYCEDGYSQNPKANPVILIASHSDCIPYHTLEEFGSQTEHIQFYEALEKFLPEEHLLKGHVSLERYFEIECPPQKKLNKDQAEVIENVRKCIVKTARSLENWDEKIPLKWTVFELFLRKNKEKRILSRQEIQNTFEFQSLRDNEKEDMLRYFKEIGLIIYFAEPSLKENVIVDVQWFSNAFTNIITDPTHARVSFQKRKEWDIFMTTGRITDSTLVNLWNEKMPLYVDHKGIIIPYMEKLGILAIMHRQEGDEEKIDLKLATSKIEPEYYIPSINKTDFLPKREEAINGNVNKTPVLVFFFKTYIPHFFFFRLVALCFSLWEPVRDDLLCKNVAFFKDKGGDRNIAIAVNKTSIQLQVLTPDKAIKLTNDKTKQIRSIIEGMMNDITSTFHHRVLYDVGYPCKDIDITDEDEDCFLREKEVAELSTNKRTCPNILFRKNHEKHDIVRDDLLYYWYTGKNQSRQRPLFQ